MVLKSDNRQNLILNHGQFFTVLDLLNLFISLYISSSIIDNAVFGASLSVCGFALQNYFMLRKQGELENKGFLSGLLGVLMTMILLFTGLFFYMYPSLTGKIGSVCVATITIILFIRSLFTLLFIKNHSGNRRQCAIITTAIQLAGSAVIFVILKLVTTWQFARDIGILSMVYPLAVLIWLFFTRNEELVFKAEYEIGKIASYRLYNALLMCSNTSLYLSIMTYVSILVLMPTEIELYLPVALWLAIIFTCIVITGRILRRGALKNIEKSSLFLAGGFLWFFSYLQLNESFKLFDISLLWIWSLVQAMGLGLMMLLSTYMQEDMKLVLELTDDASDTAVRTNSVLVQQAALLIASICIYFELSFANLVLDRQIPFSFNTSGFRASFMSTLNLLPLIFVLISMFLSLVQPVNRDIVRKLKLYREQKATDSVNLAFEDKLKRLLLRRYRVRIGIKLIVLSLKPWFYHKVINAKIVDSSQGPSVFVANHREIYGPIISNLYIPFTFRPWIENNMLDREKIKHHAWEGSIKRVRPFWLARIFLKLMVPVVHYVLNSVEPIPVYHGARDVPHTIELTVDALLELDNILIFPEDPSKTSNGRYALNGVSRFHPGFVHVAKAYYRKTGKALKFYPVYANPQKRTITFGEGIAYDPDGKNEPERISEHLYQAMNSMV